MKHSPTPIIAVVTVFIFVILGMVVGGPSGTVSERDTWDAWCRDATMVWRWDDTHSTRVGLDGYGAAQLQHTTNNYVLCDNGVKVSAFDGRRL